MSALPERDDHYHGWRLIAAWTVAAFVSYALLILLAVGLYEGLAFVWGLL